MQVVKIVSVVTSPGVFEYDHMDNRFRIDYHINHKIA